MFPSFSSKITSAILWGCISALLIAYSVFIYNKGLTNDTGTLLLYTKYMLEEGSVYAGRYEVNPPFIFLLYTPAIWFANAFDMLKYHAFNVVILVFMFVSLALTWRIHSDNRKWSENMPLLSWCSVMVILLWLMPVKWSIYGDREHLLFVFAMPWISAKLSGKGEAAPFYITIFAVLGFLIKPFNFLIPAFFFLADLMRGKPIKSVIFSKDAMIFLASGLSYIALVYVVFPDYIKDIIPIALESYSFIGLDKGGMWSYSVVMVVASLTTGYLANKEHLFLMPYAVGFIAACGLIFYLNGGWYYTGYVLSAPLGIFLTLFFYRYSDIAAHNRLFFNAFWVFFVLIASWRFYDYTKDELALIKVGDYRSVSYHHLDKRLENDFVKELQGRRFLFLTTALWSSNIVDMVPGAQNVSGYDYFWSLPWVVHKQGRYQKTASGRHLQRDIKQAFTKDPETIIIDRSPRQRKLPEKFDIKEFFMNNDDVFRQKFQNYEYVTTFDYCALSVTIICRYEIWNKKNL